ncbi:hypothetical protein [Pseudomonas sp. TWP3-2]|uniref:hypothetical protein n=1 Tax=Pseudomonas sp. TWP3-2 TaxID=2804574 RepID=UPI003CF00536
MNPSDIENTDGWLGNPEPLETCRHQLRMYENEFESLTLQLARALENVQGLVRMNDEITRVRDSLRVELDWAKTDLLREKRSFAEVEHQRQYLQSKNQRLLRERRNSEEE